MMPVSIPAAILGQRALTMEAAKEADYVYLQLTRDQFSVLFDMMVFYIASTERTPARNGMIEVQRTIQVQAGGQYADPAAIS